MDPTEALQVAAQHAASVLADFSARQRIDEGYTRIDPAQIASDAGVMVIYRPLDRLLGGFLREDGVSGIIVNVSRPRGLIHMTCAHELGHYFLGHESTADDTIDHGSQAQMIEQQADQFAYSLLTPKWLIDSALRGKEWTPIDLLNPSIVYQLSLRLGTSYKAMVWSLKGHGLISEVPANQMLGITPKELKLKALDGQELIDAYADVWVLDSHDRDRILEPGPHDQFIAHLPNHAACGRLWSMDVLQSEGFILKPQLKDARTMTHPTPGSVAVGGGAATMRYVLTPPETIRLDSRNVVEDLSTAPRRCAVSMREVTPWSPISPPHDVFAFQAECETLKHGLSGPERSKRLAAAQSIG